MKRGENPLHLTVTVKAVGRNGERTQLDLAKKEHEILVRVTPMMWLDDSLSALTGLFKTTKGTLEAVTAMLLALGAAVLAFRKLRKPRIKHRTKKRVEAQPR
jgi:hypothetical protein